MNKPLCPFTNEFKNPCNRPMYEVGSRNDSSAGEVETEYQCHGLNSHHKIYIREPIPGWKKKERKVEIRPNCRRMTPGKRRKILIMLAQGTPYPQIAKATGFSIPTICRLKQITILATMGTVLRGLR